LRSATWGLVFVAVVQLIVTAVQVVVTLQRGGGQ
jgi:hypothetical protein